MPPLGNMNTPVRLIPVPELIPVSPKANLSHAEPATLAFFCIARLTVLTIDVGRVRTLLVRTNGGGHSGEMLKPNVASADAAFVQTPH